MFDRLRTFVRAVGQLIYDPNLLEDYRSLTSTMKRYAETAEQERRKLQEAYDQVSVELSFRKTMETEGISVGQSYIDKELGPELLLDRPWETQDQSIRVSVLYVKVTGLSVENGTGFVETNLGKVRAERFLDRKNQGKLMTVERSLREDDRQKMQPEETQIPSTSLSYTPGYKELREKMQEAGFVPVEISTSNDALLWEDVKTGKNFSLDDWQQVKDLLVEIEQGKIVGMLFYAGGDAQWFEDPDKYIKTYEEELSYRGAYGVSARTMIKDPAVRKAVDDMLYGEFGEENPHDMEYYAQQQKDPEVDAIQQEADGMEM